MTIDDEVDAIIARANELAPNSNFRIDGWDRLKFANVVQAMLEHLQKTQNALFYGLTKEGE